jgi:ribosome-binding protein aMBF1 (putative translation factor)
MMPASFQSEYKKHLFGGLRDGARSLPAFDQDVAAKIGRCIAVRRSLCGLSKQQLGARLGIDSTNVDAYEQGSKRISCKLLLETAKQLKARPRFFFQKVSVKQSR